TFELIRFPATRFSGVWPENGGSLESVEAVDDLTVQFTFTDPLHQQWGERLYDVAIVPAHLWGDRTEDEVAAGANENPVGSGPYMYESHDETRMVWVTNPNWWATEHLGRAGVSVRNVEQDKYNNSVDTG